MTLLMMLRTQEAFEYMSRPRLQMILHPATGQPAKDIVRFNLLSGLLQVTMAARTKTETRVKNKNQSKRECINYHIPKYITRFDGPSETEKYGLTSLSVTLSRNVYDTHLI